MAKKKKTTTKRKRRYSRRGSGFLGGLAGTSSSGKGIGSVLTDIALTMGGLVVASQIQSLIEKKDAVSGTDLFGFDGETSKLSTPAIVGAVGLAGSLLIKNKVINKISNGIVLAAGAKFVNNLTGKSVVALGAPEDENVVLPGIAGGEQPMLPGIAGDEVYVDENGNVVNGVGEIVYDPQTGQPLQTVNGGLPTNNDLMAVQYVPGVSPVGIQGFGNTEFEMSGVEDDAYFN